MMLNDILLLILILKKKMYTKIKNKIKFISY